MRVRCFRAGAAVAVWAFVALSLLACAGEGEVSTSAVVFEPRPGPIHGALQPPDVVVETSPNRVRAEIVRWFSSAGYQPFQAAALAEHAKIESGFRPCARGAGLRYTYQWGGTRLRRLDEFAGSHGQCPPLDKQLAFADRELRDEPTFSCFWQAKTEAAALSALRRGFGRGSC
jgi:hypothetical protein